MIMSAPGGAASSSSRRIRSSPIAIVRLDGGEGKNTAEQRRRRSSTVGDSSDDDDYDDFVAGDAMAALTVAERSTYVGSIPTKPRGMKRRTKAAPLSTSLPPPNAPLLKGEVFRERETPPPMRLPEHSESAYSQYSNGTTYGSLRDSQMEGKFLDGPTSYRDKVSGEIHRLRHDQTIRLDDSATSNKPLSSRLVVISQSATGSTPSLLLPPQQQRQPVGERLARVKPSDNTSSPMSTLATMMQDPPPQAATITSMSTTTSFYDQDDKTDDDAVLSTSLTGLEVLRAARQKPEILSHIISKPSSMPPDLLPPNAGMLLAPPPSAISPSFSSGNLHNADEEDDQQHMFELDLE